MRIAIIGGGIAGLAAAYELEKARAAGAPVEYTLFEARPRLGGSLASEIVNGAVLERGPDSFLTEKPAAAELCRELGLGGELMPSNDAARKTYIVVRNRLVPLPDGLMFLVPTKLVPTALTRLFSLRTKMRMALELLHPPRPSGQRRVRGGAGEAALRAGGRGPACRSAAQRHLWRRRHTTERANRAAAPGGDGDEVRLADARHAGRAPEDARGDARTRPKDQNGGAADLHRAARRHAAVGRCAHCAARSGLSAHGNAGERDREDERRLER